MHNDGGGSAAAAYGTGQPYLVAGPMYYPNKAGIPKRMPTISL